MTEKSQMCGDQNSNPCPSWIYRTRQPLSHQQGDADLKDILILICTLYFCYTVDIHPANGEAESTRRSSRWPRCLAASSWPLSRGGGHTPPGTQGKDNVRTPQITNKNCQRHSHNNHQHCHFLFVLQKDDTRMNSTLKLKS